MKEDDYIQEGLSQVEAYSSPQPNESATLSPETDGNDGSSSIEDEKLSLKEVIAERATEDEAPHSRNFTLRKILGGDILNARVIRQQLWLIVLIVFFMIIYVSNRYSCQKDLIEIDKLQKELQEAKYKALSSSSQLTEQCRESHVLDLLKQNNDSTLKIANQPTYIIDVNPDE